MKKHLIICVLVLCTFFGCKDNSGLYGLLNDIDDRLVYLEQLCKQFNTNIESLQTIIEVQQGGDYITAVVPVKEGDVEIGYTITFAKHGSVTIYHGKDGTDGTDGHTPIIGVAQDTDGVYYWTLDGTWLLDGNGDKLRVTGEDGTDGTDGTSAITPQLKIEDDYWYISYDEGATWTQLSKAKGDKGDKGDNGNDGDSMFQSVMQDENYVYFTLINGTVITIDKHNDLGNVSVVDGAIQAAFSVSATKKVYFSKGNLIYSKEGSHRCADGTTQLGTWSFAENQWDEGTELFWGNSGYNDTIIDVPISPASDESYLLKYYVNFKDIAQYNIAGTYYDWGVYNSIENGGSTPNVWRTLTKQEWEYLWSERPNADKLHGTLSIDDIYICTYILPDSWSHLGTRIPSVLYTGKQIFETFPMWEELDKQGVVLFLNRKKKKENMGDNAASGYWSSTYSHAHTNSYGSWLYAYAILGQNPEDQMTCGSTTSGVAGQYYAIWQPVRLVKDVE